MAATRTQIYLTTDQRSKLDELTAASGATLAELIREAVDAYLERQPSDPDAVLATTFGAAPDFEVPPRSEWEDRERRIWSDRAAR